MSDYALSLRCDSRRRQGLRLADIAFQSMNWSVTIFPVFEVEATHPPDSHDNLADFAAVAIFLS